MKSHTTISFNDPVRDVNHESAEWNRVKKTQQCVRL